MAVCSKSEKKFERITLSPLPHNQPALHASMSSNAAAGLTLACMTAVGNAMTDVGRKRLGKTGIGSALPQTR